MSNTASVLVDLTFAEGLKLHEQVLEARKRVHGVEHPETLGLMYSMPSTLYRLKRIKEAHALML